MCVRLPTGISLTQSVRKIVGTRRMRYKQKWCDADVCVQSTQNARGFWREKETLFLAFTGKVQASLGREVECGA